jgi:hypothetical protein
MQSEKGQFAFENIDDILAEKIIDHTKTSADANALDKSDVVNENISPKRRLSRLVKPAVLIFLSISFAAFLLMKIRNNCR